MIQQINADRHRSTPIESLAKERPISRAKRATGPQAENAAPEENI